MESDTASLPPPYYQVVSGSCHALCVSCSLQGCHVCVRCCRVSTAQGHPAKGVSGGSIPAHTRLHKLCTLAGSGLHLPSVKNTFFLVCSKCCMGSPHVPVPCTLRLFFCVPFLQPSPASNREDLWAAFLRRALAGRAAAASSEELPPQPCGAFPLLINAVSCLSKLLCRHYHHRLGQMRACLQSWMAKTKR